MAPKVYSIRASPPVRAVFMCAKALGLKVEEIFVNLLEGEHLKEDFLKKNPQHTVPVLEDDDGFILSDSHAIMAYLVNKYGKDDSLYPKNDYKQRAIIDHRMHFDSGILFARGLVCSKPLIYRDEQPTQEKLDELKDAFQILDRMLRDNKVDYVAGNKPTIADFSIVASITSWDVLIPYSEFPNIKTYVERAQKHPWYEENKEGLAQYKEMMKSKLKI